MDKSSTIAEIVKIFEFTNEEYKASLEAARPAMAYLPGQILYYHGHLEEARERLMKVIDRWPSKDEAAYAASLIVDSWSEEEDLAKVRMWAGKFARMRLGSMPWHTARLSVSHTSAKIPFETRVLRPCAGPAFDIWHHKN